MDSDDEFLANQTLDSSEWRGVLELSNALGDFEPLARRSIISKQLAERLVSRGLAETGPCPAGFNPESYPLGFRLTTLGWKIRGRGRWATSWV